MNCCIEGSDNIDFNFDRNKIVWPIFVRQKIPRPPNAFMLFANEHRRFLAHLYPTDPNKEISRRLGQSWKDLSMQEKNKYFQRAKDIDQEHKMKYPGYVYNPKDARMRKALRSNLKDRSNIGVSSRPLVRRVNTANSVDFYQNLIMANPLTQFRKQSPMWNGLMDSTSGPEKPCTMTPFLDSGSVNSDLYREASQLYGSSANQDISPLNLTETSKEERSLFEKERTSLEAAEKYTKVGKYEEMMQSNYLPLSKTKFTSDPELFTNNAEYHKEYIVKYFNHIPDYETYNVITDDGVSFPYVTIPNLRVRQGFNDLVYMNVN